jgi:hypothetical protein
MRLPRFPIQKPGPDLHLYVDPTCHCPPSGHRKSISQDIGNPARRVPGGGRASGGVESQACDHCGCHRGSFSGGGRPGLCGIEGMVSKLIVRYRAKGEAAFEPRSRRPKTSPNAISPETVERIIRLRKQLAEQGLDAGPDTIAWHLEHHHHITVSTATISRYLTARGMITPARRNGPARPTSASKPPCQTKPGRPTSPTTHSPTAPAPRSSPGSTTTPATEDQRADTVPPHSKARGRSSGGPFSPVTPITQTSRASSLK